MKKSTREGMVFLLVVGWARLLCDLLKLPLENRKYTSPLGDVFFHLASLTKACGL
jgi:hypothetical protein